MIIDLISVPLWQGKGSIGPNFGPSKLIHGGLLDFITNAGHTLGDIMECKTPQTIESEASIALKYKTSVIDCCNELSSFVLKSLDNGHFPIILGGDHSLAIGTLKGINNFTDSENLSVIWIDAHTDINPSDLSFSHNIHGMPLSFCIGEDKSSEFKELSCNGHALNPKNLYYIGSRSVDKPEQEILKKLNIKSYGMDDIKSMGIKNIVSEILNSIKTPYIHISFDVDFIDCDIFPYTGVPVHNGPSLEDAEECLDLIIKSNKVISLDFVEYDPTNDVYNEGLEMCNKLLKVVLKNSTKVL